MNFTSQICTTEEQSKRLLALGLKKETADMHHYHTVDFEGKEVWYPSTIPYGNVIVASDFVGETEICLENNTIPAWSLHRLIEMMPEWISYPTQYDSAPLRINKDSMYYLHRFFDRNGDEDTSTVGDNEAIGSHNIYDYAVSVIGFIIKGGYFNKEYLEE